MWRHFLIFEPEIQLMAVVENDKRTLPHQLLIIFIYLISKYSNGILTLPGVIRDSLMNRHLRTCSLEGEVAIIERMQFWLGGQVTKLVRIVRGVSK